MDPLEELFFLFKKFLREMSLFREILVLNLEAAKTKQRLCCALLFILTSD